MRFTLMNEDTEVLDFTYDEDAVSVTAIHDVFDLIQAPLAIWNERIAHFATADTLTILTDRWWKRRSIPSSRHNREHLRHLVGSTLDHLTAKTYALTLTDHYWARPLDSSLTWPEVNFFDYDFEDGIGLLLAGISDTPPHDPSAIMTPSANVGGDLPKMWHVAPNGTREL